MRSREAGLTLVELMVVVAVMAVIAAIAYPLYTTQTQKARRADAKVAVETVALAQERVYTLDGRYYLLSAGTLQAQLPSAIAGGNSKEGYYSVAVTQVSNQDFTVTATPKSSDAQASDATNCASFTINHQGIKTATGTAANCW